MSNKIGWELYRTFLHVLQEGTLSGAARALGISQPTVGRHVALLEEELGAVLFTRSMLGLVPTDTAIALRRDIEAMQSSANAAERIARANVDSIGGTVRISASEVIGVEVLPAILAEFARAYPGINIELVLSNRVQDLVRREVDIAIRMAELSQDVLVATAVGQVELGLFAHKDYLEHRAPPRMLEELAQHRLIGFDVESPFVRSARAGRGFWLREHFGFRCDSDLAQLALLRAGSGIGICQVALAERDAALIRVLVHEFSLSLKTWVVMHEGLRTQPACRAVFNALADGMRKYTLLVP